MGPALPPITFDTDTTAAAQIWIQGDSQTIIISSTDLSPWDAPPFDELEREFKADVPREFGWIWVAALGATDYPVRNYAPARKPREWSDNRLTRRDRKPP